MLAATLGLVGQPVLENERINCAPAAAALVPGLAYHANATPSGRRHAFPGSARLARRQGHE